MSICKSSIVVFSPASVTCTVKNAVPKEADDVPLITPSGLSISPGGNAPLTIDQV